MERLLRAELANQSGSDVIDESDSEDADAVRADEEPEMLSLPQMKGARMDFEQNPQERFQRRPRQRLPRRTQPRRERAAGIGSLNEPLPQPPPPFTHTATPFVFDGREFEVVDFTLPQFTPFTLTASPFTLTASPFTLTASPFTLTASPFTLTASPFTLTASPFTLTASPFTLTASPFFLVTSCQILSL